MAADIEYVGDATDNNVFGTYRKMYGLGGNDILASDFGGFAKIYGGSGGDTLSYYGTGRAKIVGGKGPDAAYGGAKDDNIIGGKGNDFLSGNNGDDSINGGQGGDWIFGGLGNDWLKGGKGPDHFGFNTAPDSKMNFDTIGDFNPKQDLLHFNHYVYASGWSVPGEIDKSFFRKGKGPKDEDDYFGYNKNKGFIWYDLNGSDPGGFNKVADVGENLNIKYTHFIFD